MIHQRAQPIDEPLQMRRDAESSTGFETYFYHQDDLFNVVALPRGSDGTPGNFVERVTYGDYGLPTINDANGAAIGTESAFGNPFLFTGREWDNEFRFYQYRTRSMDPMLGRFTTRDTIGTWGDGRCCGNAICMSASTPYILVDPYGYESEPPPLLVPIPLDFREGQDSSGNPLRFTDNQKKQLAEGMQAASNRAQCASEGSNNDKSRQRAENGYKVYGVDQANRIDRLKEYLDRYCGGRDGGKALPIEPYFDEPEPRFTPSSKTYPNDDSGPIWYPLRPDTLRSPRRDIVEDRIHEPSIAFTIRTTLTDHTGYCPQIKTTINIISIMQLRRHAIGQRVRSGIDQRERQTEHEVQ